MALTDNLVGYYKFDEISGSSVSDATGNGNTGTWQGTLGSQWIAGLINNAGNFDGATNYVTLPTNMLSGVNTLTVSLWAYYNGFPTNALELFQSFGGANGGLQTGFQLFTDNTGGSAAPFKLRLLGSQNIVSSITPSLHTWYHVVGTYDGTTGQLYVNGGNLQSAVAIGTITQNNPQIGYFGGNVSNSWMDGRVDEVGIWTRVLSFNEITQLYNGGAGLQYPFSTTTTGTVGKTIQSLRVNFVATSMTIASNVNARGIILSSTQDCYVDFDQPISTQQSYRIFGSNTRDSTIEMTGGSVKNIYVQGVSVPGTLYITVIY